MAITWPRGIAKAWIKCNFAGAIQASYNVTSITDGGVGLVTVTIGTDFGSAEYVVVATLFDGGTTGIVAIVNAAAAGSINLACRRPDTNALADAGNWLIACFGDQ